MLWTGAGPFLWISPSCCVQQLSQEPACCLGRCLAADLELVRTRDIFALCLNSFLLFAVACLKFNCRFKVCFSVCCFCVWQSPFSKAPDFFSNQLSHHSTHHNRTSLPFSTIFPQPSTFNIIALFTGLISGLHHSVRLFLFCLLDFFTLLF